MTLTRRELLRSGAKVGAGGCVYLLIGACVPNEELHLIDISAVLIHPERAREIGEVFARKFPDEVNMKALETRVLGSLSERGENGRGSLLATNPSSEEINRRLDQLIRDDFEANRVFLFNGWILSRTEGQLCALARSIEGN